MYLQLFYFCIIFSFSYYLSFDFPTAKIQRLFHLAKLTLHTYGVIHKSG